MIHTAHTLGHDAKAHPVADEPPRRIDSVVRIFGRECKNILVGGINQILAREMGKRTAHGERRLARHTARMMHVHEDCATTRVDNIAAQRQGTPHRHVA